MLNRFMKLFTGQDNATARNQSSAPNSEFAQLNQIAPVATPDSEHNNSTSDPMHSVVCREAILNKDQRVAGYTFMLRRTINQRVRVSSSIVQRLYDEVLLRNILSMNIQRLLGHRLAFIPILPSSLEYASRDHDLLKQMPGTGTVFVISASEQLPDNSEAMQASIQDLKKSGYLFGLQGDMGIPGMQPFLELAEYIFIDIASSDIPAMNAQIASISKQVFDKQLVATNIQTLEEFHVCAKLPFSYFQGPFVTNKEQWTSSRMDTGRIKILDLLNRIRRDAETAELIPLFKQDPALSFKLMRYINSAGAGLTSKVSSIDQALIVLGRQKLYRWLTLLLFTSSAGDELEWALMENALVRARLAELLAQDTLPSNARDELFVAGIFSLLDILLHIPMEQVLVQVSLPPLVTQALLHQQGEFAPYLALAIACEEFDQERIAILARPFNLSVAQVNAIHADALIWAQQVDE